MEVENGKTLDLLCIGACCVDMIFAGMSDIPGAGQEAYCDDFIIKGGGGANTPVAAAKLGLKTALVTQLGNDLFGRMLVDMLAQSGVSTEGIVVTEAEKTAVSAVMSISGGERAFASYDKGMGAVNQARIEAIALKARHVHTYIGYCRNYPLLDIAETYGCTVSLDTSWYPGQNLRDYQALLGRCDVFMPNEAEACLIAGCEDVYEAGGRINAYARNVIIKMGKSGALLFQNGRHALIPGASGVMVKDTTGAGDMFNAGFLYGYLSGFSMEEAVKFANASGALGVGFMGGMDDSYGLQEVKAIRGRM